MLLSLPNVILSWIYFYIKSWSYLRDSKMPKPTKIYLFTNLFRNVYFDIILHKIALKCKEGKYTFICIPKSNYARKTIRLNYFSLGLSQ
jgi:hypothetical protein